MMNIFKRKGKRGDRGEEMPIENDGFPDSERPHGLCPRCNKQSSFEQIGELPATYSSEIVISELIGNNRKANDRVVCMVCRNCTQPVIVLEECYINNKPLREEMSAGQLNWRGFFWWPFLSAVKIDSVPDQISSILNEAKLCFATKCFRASAVMARRTLEAIAVNKGETS